MTLQELDNLKKRDLILCVVGFNANQHDEFISYERQKMKVHIRDTRENKPMLFDQYFVLDNYELIEK